VTNLEKIHALQAGEFDAALKGTDSEHYRFNEMPIVKKMALAAKVEVTKGVLDEAVERLNYAVGRDYTNCVITVRETLTLLKILQETLKQ
jgi:hypothetical protein